MADPYLLIAQTFPMLDQRTAGSDAVLSRHTDRTGVTPALIIC